MWLSEWGYQCTMGASHNAHNIWINYMKSKAIDNNKFHFNELLWKNVFRWCMNKLLFELCWCGVSSDDNQNDNKNVIQYSNYWKSFHCGRCRMSFGPFRQHQRRDDGDANMSRNVTLITFEQIRCQHNVTQSNVRKIRTEKRFTFLSVNSDWTCIWIIMVCSPWQWTVNTNRFTEVKKIHKKKLVYWRRFFIQTINRSLDNMCASDTIADTSQSSVI